MTLLPLHLEPVHVEKPWGGFRLSRTPRNAHPDSRIGERWLVADLALDETAVPDPCSTVRTGPYRGNKLAELVEVAASELLGLAASHGGRFPLLVKVLDAREDLSVQVHPTNEYAAHRPGCNSKTESWLVLSARPGAVLYLGVKHGVSIDDVRRAAGTPELVGMLRQVPARPGSLHHLPSGLIHALGAGVTVLEVQTPSDTTFRLYDWTREYERQPRPLHIAEALEIVGSAWGLNVDPRRSQHRSVSEGGLLLETASYQIFRHQLHVGGHLAVAPGQAKVLYVIDGRVAGDNFTWPIRDGEVILLPACWQGRAIAEVWSQVIEVRVGPARA